MSRIRRAAMVASLAWVVLVLSYAIGFFAITAGVQPRGTVFLDGMFFLIALVLPLMLVWLAAFLAEELERQRMVVAALAELAHPLILSLDAARDTLRTHGPAAPQDIQRAVQGAMLGARGADPTGALERLLAGQARIQAELRALGGAAPAAAAPDPAAGRDPRARKGRAAPAGDQPDLPMLPEAEAGAALDWPDLIRALDFPRDAEDRDGFRALKRALRHHSLAQMLQAAEDVLNLLSQEGVYMDDLTVVPGAPEAWRRFIDGARGAEVAGVGGVRDPRPLEIARGLMKSDPIFRDTALFFQRRFDGVLQDFAQDVDDAQLMRLADTRTGRAFMLLARLSGAFD